MQDLTPQLRTRLSRVERLVGWFVLIATLLLAAGFAYYFYVTADRKGWFITKLPYYTYLKNATGLRVGDPVRLMGFTVGQIVEIQPTEAGNDWYTQNQYNVFVQFVIRDPYFGYIWTDSHTKVITGDFLGSRVLEVAKGANGYPTVHLTTNNLPDAMLKETYSQADKEAKKTPEWLPLAKQPKGYWLRAVESPALTERFDDIADRIQGALPGFFALTNRITEMLTSGSRITSNLNNVIVELQPVTTNIGRITATLTNTDGSLGRWMLGTNLENRLGSTIDAAHSTLHTADTNLATISSNLNLTLIHLANLTSNLNSQVQTNEAIVKVVSDTIKHADEFVQGLKRHWLLRSAFKKEEEKKPGRTTEKVPRGAVPPRGKEWQR